MTPISCKPVISAQNLEKDQPLLQGTTINVVAELCTFGFRDFNSYRRQCSRRVFSYSGSIKSVLFFQQVFDVLFFGLASTYNPKFPGNLRSVLQKYTRHWTSAL